MASPIFRFRNLRLDPATRQLWRDGERVPLPLKSFDCLTYLIEHRDRAVGRDELIAAVWGRAEVSDKLLGQTLLRARRAIGDASSEHTAIRTLPRFGYTRTAIAQAFTTRPEPVECAYGLSTSIVFDDGLESGAAGWTHGAAAGGIDPWSLGSTAHGGTHAWQAGASASGSPNESWLISPTVALPSNLSSLNLSFWNRQQLKAPASGGCYDGALLDMSTDGGAWTQVTSGFLTTPYDGTITSSFSNPLGGTSAWCGDPRPYAKSVIDLQDHAGRTVKFRFRLGHDRLLHREAPNWAIDDVRVAGCATSP